jgi:hypothetical protein
MCYDGAAVCIPLNRACGRFIKEEETMAERTSARGHAIRISMHHASFQIDEWTSKSVAKIRNF